MPFDIFQIERMYPTSFGEHIFGPYFVVAFIAAIFGGLLSVLIWAACNSIDEIRYDILQDDRYRPDTRYVRLGVGVGLITFALTLLGTWHASEETHITNMSEVRTQIHEKYGVELTDESLERLYEHRNVESQDPLYIADVNGRPQAYIVTDGEFYFFDEMPNDS